MIVRIEVVISTAGNDEEYVGKHLGMKLLGRPLDRMVVTFEAEITQEELESMRDLISDRSFDDIHSENAIRIYACKVYGLSEDD